MQVRASSTSYTIRTRLFHALTRSDPTRRPDPSPEEDFAAGFTSAERFFARLPPLELRGKSVLDFGCGLGSACFLIAERGARRVVGIDMQSVDFAREQLRVSYGQFAGTIDFLQIDPAAVDLGGERFDVVISKDTFEHVDDPDAYVAAMNQHLVPGGAIAIGFGPLWKSPWGAHIGFMTRFPWAHLVFPEPVILEERRRFRPDEDPARFEEIKGGLNRMTLARFIDTMERSGLSREYLKLNAKADIRSPLRRAVLNGMAGLSRLPGLREYLTQNVYSIWRLPTTPES